MHVYLLHNAVGNIGTTYISRCQREPTGVKDARDDSELSMDEAVARGIIDQASGVYNNLKTGEKYPIPVAMNAGFIIGWWLTSAPQSVH